MAAIDESGVDEVDVLVERHGWGGVGLEETSCSADEDMEGGMLSVSVERWSAPLVRDSGQR